MLTTTLNCDMEFKQRIILLHNGVCCLVSKQPDSSNLFLILSPSGAYARIYFQGNQYQHLTRFVPVRFEESIKQLLKFRNTFSDQPFLCKRFHSTGTETSDMSPNVSTQCVEYHSWKLHVCPLLRRISLFKDYCINTDDNCIEYPIRGVDLARSHMIKCERVYPLCRIPSTVRQAILSSTTSKTNIKEIKCIMQSAEAVAGSSHSVVAIDSLAETSHFLDALMIHMSILASDRDAYPVGISATNEEKLHMLGELETLVVAECLDEDVYLVSNGPAEGSGNVDVRQLKKALRRIQSSGSSAISNKMEENKPNLEEESLEESAVKSTELEVEVWIHPSDAHPAEVIIHLKGDYFTFHSQSSSGGELFEKTIHYSFLQYELHRRAQVLELGPDDLSWASTSAPDNENDDYASFSAVMLLHRYYKQALKLIRYRDYLLENSQRCGEAAFNRALLTQDKLHESTADRRLPYQQDKQLNKYSQASGSCSTVSITSEDGSTFSAVLKYCADAAEAAPFSLVLSQVPSSQYATVPPVKSSPRGRVFPCDCVTQISATFADHTMLKFDLVSQVIFSQDYILQINFIYYYVYNFLSDVFVAVLHRKRMQL